MFPLYINKLQLLNNICDLSVHKLRPGDIKVVAAVGDSLTVSIKTKVILLTFFIIRTIKLKVEMKIL